MIERIIPFAHSKVKDIIKESDIVIDATCGNGHDTLFLSKIAHHVFAFDIQEQAILETKAMLEQQNVTNVTVIQDSHISFKKHNIDNPKVIMYNLGYLPGADHSVTTLASTTILSITEGLEILSVHGLIAITVYPGHQEGLLESMELEQFVSLLPSTQFNVLKYQMLNKNKSPYNILIEKLR